MDSHEDKASIELAPRNGMLDEVRAFRFVTAPQAPTYRAIIEVFFEAKLRYQVDLRPAQVLGQIRTLGRPVEIEDEEGLDYYLGQLAEWGLLSKSHDSSSVARIEDFYRKRYLYMLTAVGEAAQRAVVEVERTLGKRGALQAGMLGIIRDALENLAAQAKLAQPDAEKLFKLMRQLFDAFDSLTQEASRYLLDLDVQMRQADSKMSGFILRKQAVLNYVAKFLNHLRQLGEQIQQHFATLKDCEVEHLLRIAVAWADLPPAGDEENPETIWLVGQMTRFGGIRDWFVGGKLGQSMLQHLTERAMLSVLELTRSLNRINDSRGQRSDRQTDFRTLARWFAECKDDVAAHRLWQTSFGMRPARHLQIAEDDPDLTNSHSSWWESEAVNVPVRLRSHGRLNRSGRSIAVPDHKDSQRLIAARLKTERARRQKALARFVDRGPLRLSQLGRIGVEELGILLELLDEALSTDKGSIRSADGKLNIRLRRLGPGTPTADIECDIGVLSCADAELTVSRLAHGRAESNREHQA